MNKSVVRSEYPPARAPRDSLTTLKVSKRIAQGKANIVSAALG